MPLDFTVSGILKSVGCLNSGSGRGEEFVPGKQGRFHQFEVNTHEKTSDTVSGGVNGKRKKSDGPELYTDTKKRSISEHGKIESVKNEVIHKAQLDYENKSHPSTKISLTGQCELFTESDVVKEFRDFYNSQNREAFNLPGLGRIHKKKSGCGEGDLQYTKMHCEIKKMPSVIVLLNSVSASKMAELGFNPESHPYFYKTKKIKNNKECFFIGKTKRSVIKFGLLVSHDGSAGNPRLIAIKKITLKLDKPSSKSSVIEYFGLDIKKQVYFQIKASNILPTPPVLGIAVAQTGAGSLKVYLAMDIVEGFSLRHIFCTQITLSQRINIARELARQLQCLHQQSIYHGDLKANNIIVDKRPNENSCEKWKVSIIDFGESKCMAKPILIRYEPDSISSYVAPEVYCAAIKYVLCFCSKESGGGIKKESVDEIKLLFPEKAEVFSLGYIFARLLGDCPEKIISCKYDTLWSSADSFFKSLNSKLDEMISNVCIPNKDLVDLVREMTQVDPLRRPTLEKVIEKLNLTLT